MDDWKLKPAGDLDLTGKERLRSPRRESGLVESGGHLLWRWLIRAYLGVYHRLEIQGLENVPPEPPFVLVANHTSHLDAVVLAASLPWQLHDRIFPIAAGDTFFETPALAAFAAYALNALPLWRRNCGPHALQTLRDRLVNEPCAFILFPEGTRARDGAIGTFKSGVGMLVAGSSVPVVPAHLNGAFQALPPHKRVPRPVRLRVRFGSPLCFAEAANERDGWNRVAQACEKAVRELAK